MRILHISSEYPPQQIFGLGRYVCDLSCELAKQGHEVHVLTNSAGRKDQDTIEDGVHLHRVNFPPPPKPPGSCAPLLFFNLHLGQRSQFLGKKGLGKPEVVVSHDWLTAIAGQRIARRLNVPHIWTVHDTIHGKRFGKIESPGDKITFEIERWATRSADLILVNSKAIKQEVMEVYQGDPNKMRLLHCAINPDRFVSTQSASRIAGFKSVFAAPDELLLTYVGRLDMEKGIDTLVNAFAILHKEFPKCKLAIVGQGDLQETIAEHIKKLGLEDKIKLYGYLKGEVLKHFYIVSDIHVCPSHYEPFGIVATEAMAAETPVVASLTGGLTDIMTNTKVGRTFPLRDHNKLANVLLELAQQPALRKQIAKAGAKHVREYFVWPVITKKAVEHYKTILS